MGGIKRFQTDAGIALSLMMHGLMLLFAIAPQFRIFLNLRGG